MTAETIPSIQKIAGMCVNEKHQHYKTWQLVINTFIIASCMALALETVPSLWEEYETEFGILEYVSVSIFLIDYLANLFFSEKKFRYAFTIWGIIDLISILPTFLMMLNLSALQGARMLRLLRVARVLRVLKSSVHNTEHANPLVVNLKIYVIIFFAALMISSTMMYAVEGTLYVPEKMKFQQQILDAQAAASGQEAVQYMPTDPISGNEIPEDKRFFTSIPTTMWWCIVTLTSTGYGDMYPVTVKGRVVAGFTMFFGLVLFGILLNLVGKTLLVAFFGEKLKTDEDD